MPTFSHDSVGSLVIRITVLVADHPHLTHLVRPRAAKARGRRLSFSLRLEHRLLGLAVGSCHGRCRCEHQRDDSKTDALQRDGLFRITHYAHNAPISPEVRRHNLTLRQRCSQNNASLYGWADPAERPQGGSDRVGDGPPRGWAARAAD